VEETYAVVKKTARETYDRLKVLAGLKKRVRNDRLALLLSRKWQIALNDPRKIW
jgi:hypothetical protein